MIVSILKDDMADELPAAAMKDQFFCKSSNRVTLFAPVAEYEISSPHKTVAHLTRGGKYPSIAAMSGWSHGKTVPLVSGRDLTSDVLRIANIVGHALVADSRDRGIPGQFNACHAEKQLIAYFISRHVFLEPESRAPERAWEHLDRHCYTHGELGAAMPRVNYEQGGTLHELAARAPPLSLKQASILVSSPPCYDCISFTNVVNTRLDLHITVEHHSNNG